MLDFSQPVLSSCMFTTCDTHLIVRAESCPASKQTLTSATSEPLRRVAFLVSPVATRKEHATPHAFIQLHYGGPRIPVFAHSRPRMMGQTSPSLITITIAIAITITITITIIITNYYYY